MLNPGTAVSILFSTVEIDFIKLHCCKNDSILVPKIDKDLPDDTLSKIAYMLSRRYEGVGGNSVLFILPGSETKVRIREFKRNGEENPRPVDSLFSAARYIFDLGLVGKEDMFVETAAGIKRIEIIDSKNFRQRIGQPSDFAHSKIITEDPDGSYNIPVELDNHTFFGTPVSMVDYFTTFFLQTQEENQLKKIIKKSGGFPDIQNKHSKGMLAETYSRDELNLTIWPPLEQFQRSWAVGAGLVASVVNGFSDRMSLVHINHCEMFAEWSERDNTVYITAKGEYIFSGTYYLDD